MSNYKILPHPADVKIQAFGETKEELFLNAMMGMNAVLQPRPKADQPALPVGRPRAGKIQRKIKVKSIDVNALLVDFLSEVLYLIQTNKEVYNNIKFKKFSDPSNSSGQAELEGELFGNKVESFGEDIKAVTYHGLKIIRNKKGLYEATVLFDI